MSVHKTLAFFVAPEWALDDEEKREMAVAILDVGQHYTKVLEKFDAKTTAWINFGQAFAAIYITRLYEIHERRKDERKAAQATRPQPAPPPPRMTPEPMRPRPPENMEVVQVNGATLQPEKKPEAPPEMRRATIPGANVQVEFPKDHPLFKVN